MQQQHSTLSAPLGQCYLHNSPKTATAQQQPSAPWKKLPIVVFALHGLHGPHQLRTPTAIHKHPCTKRHLVDSWYVCSIYDTLSAILQIWNQMCIPGEIILFLVHMTAVKTAQVTKNNVEDAHEQLCKWKESWYISWCYPRIFLEELKKTTRTIASIANLWDKNSNLKLQDIKLKYTSVNCYIQLVLILEKILASSSDHCL